MSIEKIKMFGGKNGMYSFILVSKGKNILFYSTIVTLNGKYLKRRKFMSIKMTDPKSGKSRTFKTEEEFLKFLGYKKSDYKKSTKQGYPITNIFTSKSGIKFVVGKRPNDYFVGAGYESSYGTWGQDYYGFKNRKDAVKFAKNGASCR